VLYAAVSSSFYHLTVIAWERYVAIKKWNRYKVIVTRARVKIAAGMTWLLAVIMTVPVRIMAAAEVDDKYLNVLNIISAAKTIVCVALIGYFYIVAYLGVRSQKHKESGKSMLGVKSSLRTPSLKRLAY